MQTHRYHIVRVPEGTGGTVFAHQGAAFDALPAADQERWQRLISVNSNSGVLHPLVHEHPISRRKSVWLHLGMTGAVLELDRDEGSKSAQHRLLQHDEMKRLFHQYNDLLNAGLADRSGLAPPYGTSVVISGQRGDGLDGKSATVVGMLDRATDRVAIKLDDGQVDVD